ALSESEEKLLGILAGIGDIITIQNKNLDIIWVNQPVRDLWGDVIGKKCYTAYKGLDAPCPDCTAEKVFNKGKKYVSDQTVVKLDGSSMHTLVTSSPVRDAEGNIVAVVETVKEITEQKKLETALKESERRYRGLYESSVDGIASADLNGTFIECNQAYADMLGYTKEELRYKTYWELSPKKWRDITARIHREQVFKRGYSNEYEKEYIRKDGTVFPISIRTWVIKDDDGNPLGTWGIIRDITERKKVDQMKSQFVNLAAHELRTPLSALKAHVELLDMKSKGMDLPEDINRRIGIIMRNAKRLAVIINNLLDYTRLEAGTMKIKKNLGSLDVVVSQVVNEVIPLAKKNNHELNLHTPEMLPLIQMDKEMIRTVFNNLISNAIKYTPDGGKIEVIIREDDDQLHATVRDTGIGIAEEDIEMIFHPFHVADIPESVRFKTEFERTGLGLAIIKEYVKMHGGYIWVESQIGEGSSFHVILPID
ncbi:MAG: PAS domain S-box protein, partial [Candidatus Lokiarchaeota archaeon]|nr:PAS domain S-box protein [Candidatus Lokiarchaeota archaeon]